MKIKIITQESKSTVVVIDHGVLVICSHCYECTGSVTASTIDKMHFATGSGQHLCALNGTVKSRFKKPWLLLRNCDGHRVLFPNDGQ